MLRPMLIVAAAVLTCIGLGLIACGVAVPGWQTLIVGLILLIGTVFERWRYRRIGDVPKGNWQQTGEEFIDPSTGVPVEVLYDAHTGERRYVAKKHP
jgi:hypothetical protein